MRSLLAAVVLALSGCATHPVVVGAATAHASNRDVEAIRALLAPTSKELRIERDVWRPVSRIVFQSADRALVEMDDASMATHLVVRKRAGEWHIDRTSVQTRVLTTT